MVRRGGQEVGQWREFVECQQNGAEDGDQRLVIALELVEERDSARSLVDYLYRRNFRAVHLGVGRSLDATFRSHGKGSGHDVWLLTQIASPVLLKQSVVNSPAGGECRRGRWT